MIDLKQAISLTCVFNYSRYLTLQAPHVHVSAFEAGAPDCFGIIDTPAKMYAGYMNKKVKQGVAIYRSGEQSNYTIHTCVPVAH